MRKELEKKNKNKQMKMNKEKIISMILTITILILLAGSMVRISKAEINVIEQTDDTSTEIPALTESGSTLSGQAPDESSGKPPEGLQEEEKYTTTLVSNDGKTKVKITESDKVSSEEAEKTEEEITEVNIIVPPGFGDEVSNILNSEKEGFSNPGFKDNTLTYTTKYNGVPIDIIIVYNKDGTKESTTKKYGNNIIYFEEGKEKIEINHNLGIKTIDYDYEGGNYIATLSDGSKGKLTEDGNKFIYDTDEGVTRTLEALNGGGTLKFYNNNPKDGEEEIGTITITRGNTKIMFYGTFDGEEVKEKGEKVLAIDDNGNLLTDFNKKDEAQTTYYAYNVFSAYVFGRKQSDKSEKIYLPGYKPFAFKIDGEVILIRKQKDNSYKYYTSHKGEWIELKEGDVNFKEVNAMVRKTKIGPAFYSAASAARGGRALSNLLNSWLDIDFITNWRKKSDEFFSETVIGRIISGKWEESVCHSKIEKIPENIAVVNINNVMGFAAHVEGERSPAITTNNQTLYFYKITFGVNPINVGNVTFKLLIDDHAVDLDNDGMADKIELEADKTYSGTGENAIVRYKPKIYKKVCLKFYNTENLNAEFRNSLKNNKLCNKINEVDLSSVEISEPASSTTGSSTSTGLIGW